MPHDLAAKQRKQYERRKLEGLCASCGGRSGRRKPAPGRRLCPVCLKRKLKHYYRNRESNDVYNRRYREKLRDAAFEAYGGYRCSCCGEKHKEFLTFDHTDGDGADHRREIGRGSHNLILWLKRNNYPPGFRVLCMNCNFSLGMHGYCPHRKTESNECI